MYALVDGNNFYCAVEKCFRPSLHGRPIVVLGNNDGAVIARSEEAKALGIKMGVPWFQVRHLEQTEGLVALSANFTLIADMSDRMMTLAAGLGPTQFIYSIDEAFIGLHGVQGDLTRRAHIIRDRILRWTGIPCGIGIAKTMTLSKLANHVAKSAERKPGSYPGHLSRVCNLESMNQAEREAILQATDVQEVWGVGRRIGAQLREAGINTALDLARMDSATVRRRWSLTLERTVREVQGIPCIEFEDAPGPKQQIACTRSFGRPVTEVGPLVAAVAEFASRAAEKLRKQGSLAGTLMVFMHTSPHRSGPQLSRSVTVPLRRPTADSRLLAKAAADGVRYMYAPGFQFSKAGVFLVDLQPDTQQQGELDLEPEEGRDRTRLMMAMDTLNNRFGKGTVHVGATGVHGVTRTWEARQDRRTPQYTTRWEDMPVARA